MELISILSPIVDIRIKYRISLSQSFRLENIETDEDQRLASWLLVELLPSDWRIVKEKEQTWVCHPAT